MAKITRYKRFTGGLSNKDKDKITQAGLGAGIFTAVTSGTMLARTVFAVVNKGASDSMTISWDITIS